MEPFTYTQVPSGMHPMQGEGVINATGQKFYFRCRNGKVSITISKSDQTVYSIDDKGAAAEYVERLNLDTFDELPLECVNVLVRRWVNTYLALS